MLKPGVWRIQIRSPTFDAKAQIFEIRIPVLKPGVQKMGLKPHLYSITSVTSLPSISAIRLGSRPTNCCEFLSFGCWFCIYSRSNTKAQILALRFPISHAKAHISLKSRQLWVKALPTSINSEMDLGMFRRNLGIWAKAQSLLDHPDHSDAKPSSERHVRESRDLVSDLRC